MSGLYSTLGASVKALNAQSMAIEVAGKNLANVNNPNYARQRVIFGDRGTVVTTQGAQSLGLEALSIQQMRDTLLDKQVVRETSVTAGLTTEQEAYQRAQTSLGQSIDSTSSASSTSAGSTGLGAAINGFFGSFQTLAASPTDMGVRQTLLVSAATLADQLNQTDANLAQVQSDLTAQATGDVQTANTTLSQIANLNAQIDRAEVGNPGSAVDLRDTRQAAIESLAKQLPIDTVTTNSGALQVVMKDGSGANVVLVDDINVHGSVAISGGNITAGSPATTVVASSGTIAGALHARDGAIQNLRDNLDAISSQLVTSVNAAYNPTATSGADFFNPAGLTAGTITVSASVTAGNLVAGTGGAGDNSTAIAVANVATQQFSTGSGDAIDGSISQAYSSAVSGLGASLAGVNSNVDNQTKIEALVRSQRDGISGVNLDEEMADLVKFQRAYQASGRVFSIVDDLLDTVVNKL